MHKHDSTIFLKLHKIIKLGKIIYKNYNCNKSKQTRFKTPFNGTRQRNINIFDKINFPSPRLMCYVACFDFIRHLFISLLLYYPFPFFFFFLSSPPPQVSYPFFLFISIVCIPYYVVIFLHNFYNFYQAAVTVEINILLICFCSFDLFCPELDRMNE